MEFDDTYNGSTIDWNFPSPTATPTTTPFNHALFSTPKTGGLPFQYQDEFTTPQMPTFTTPQQPDYSTFTPNQKQQHFPAPPSSHVDYQTGHTGGQVMAPPRQISRPNSMIHPLSADVEWQQQHQPGQLSFNPSQMRTPPPTRGTHAKKPLPGPPIEFGTPSTIASRRFMTPQQQHHAGHDAHAMPPTTQTPLQAPYLPFSPQVYQFGNHGPATAPVQHHTQLLWGQTSPNVFASPNVLADPFAPSPAVGAMGWPVSSMGTTSAQSIPFDTPAMDSFPVQQPHPRPVSAACVDLHSAPVTGFGTSGSVNPSLVYSSPIRPQTVASNDPFGPNAEAHLPRRDSHIDLSASLRGQPDMLSQPTGSAVRPRGGLRRSNTTGNVRQANAHISFGPDGHLSRSNSIIQIPRTDSPLKRVGKPALDPISETKRAKSRTSVILTIDENGRARAETKPLEDSPTRVMREKYPALFDSDSSDADSDGSAISPNRNPSFSFSKGEERKSKAARLDDPIENLEGLHLPRSSSTSSLRVNPSRAAISAVAQLRRTGSQRRPNSSTRNLTNLNPGNRRSVIIDTCPMEGSGLPNIDTDLAARSATHHHHPQYHHHRPPPSPHDWISSAGSTLDAHNQRWNMLFLDPPSQPLRGPSISPTHSHSSYASQSAAYPFPAASLPSSNAAHHSSSSTTSTPLHLPRRIRCVCGHADDRSAAPLIQCRSCTQWSHVGCVGTGGGGRAGFTCFLCTKPMSATTGSVGLGRAG